MSLQALAAFKEILLFARPGNDSKARLLANSLIPKLYGQFIENAEISSKAVRRIIDYCNDEDVKVLYDVALLSWNCGC